MSKIQIGSLWAAKGDPGNDGASAYQLALEEGFSGSIEDWLASLKGEPGNDGDDGNDGKSAYQLALTAGFSGTLTQWLASIRGADGDPGSTGKSAYQLAIENGFSGSLTQWLASIRGVDGDPGSNGKSTYELAVSDGFSGNLTQWLASIRGAKGDDGRSAYQIAVEAGFSGTNSEWLTSLRGGKGDKGDKGDAGTTTWGGITDKPTTFTPAVHNHILTDVTGLADALASKAPLDGMTSALSYLSSLADTQGAAIGVLQTGKADLVGGVVPTSQIPSIALTNTQSVSTRAALLALTNVQEGDVGIITAGADKGSYILTSSNPAVFANWVLLSTPLDVVQSVNGQIGPVVLGKADVGLPLVDNVPDASKPVSGPQQTALDAKAALTGAAFTGPVSATTVSATTSLSTPQATITTALLTAVRTTASYRTSGVVLTTTSAELQFCDATTASFSLILPSTTSGQSSRFTIKKLTAANTVTIGGTIDGVLNYILTAQWSWITVVSSQTNNVWYIIGKG